MSTSLYGSTQTYTVPVKKMWARVVALLAFFSTVALCHDGEWHYYFGQFTEGFVWGAGTSAAQIEGAWRTDGNYKLRFPF